MQRSLLVSQLATLHDEASKPHEGAISGEVGNFGTEYTFDFSECDRGRLIGELRFAIVLAKDPENDVAEFELNDIGFCVEIEPSHE